MNWPAACTVCLDAGAVCESHRTRPWGPMCCDGPAGATGLLVICESGACHCGGAGEPCPNCSWGDRFGRRDDFVPGTVIA